MVKQQENKKRVPDFLVIGAMKAGTSTLVNDLSRHPKIYFSETKEPHFLLQNDILTKEGQKKYHTLYKNAQSDQLCGDGSSGYSKYPTLDNVAARAGKLIPTTKIIYIVREPKDRIHSHHYHLYRTGRAPANLRKALAEIPELISISKYGEQLEQWLKEFPKKQLLIIKFENYIKNRETTCKEIVDFLGLPTYDFPLLTEVTNKGEQALSFDSPLKKMLYKLAWSPVYKNLINSLLPKGAKTWVKKRFFSEKVDRPDYPDAQLKSEIDKTLMEDAEKFFNISGWKY